MAVIDWNKVNNRRRELFLRRCRNCAKNLAALSVGRFLFRRFGMKRTTAGRFILRCERAQGAMV